MKSHKFDVEDAKKYGVEKAILLEHLKFHQESNQSDERFIFEGKSHATLPPDTVKKMYPYLNHKSVYRWLTELEEDGVIQSTKPHASQSDHTKYYHVIGHNIPKSQNENSMSQNGEIMKSQNENSSILPNEEPCEATGIVYSIREAKNKKELLRIWMRYRKSKGRHMNLYEQEVTLHEWKKLGLENIKSSMLYTIQNGWVSLQQKEIDNNVPTKTNAGAYEYI